MRHSLYYLTQGKLRALEPTQVHQLKAKSPNPFQEILYIRAK